MKIAKLVGLVAALVMSATVLTAAVGSAAGGSQKKVKLVWWHNSTQGEGLKLVWNAAIKEFQKSHPNVSIKSVPLQNEEASRTKIAVGLQSNEPPDIYQQWGGGGSRHPGRGRQGAGRHGREAALSRRSAARPRAGRSTASSTACPYSLGIVGFWYNKDLFAQGRNHRATEDDGRAVRRDRKLKAAGITPISVGSKDKWPDAFYWDTLAVRACQDGCRRQVSYTSTIRASSRRDSCRASWPRTLPGRVSRHARARARRVRRG